MERPRLFGGKLSDYEENLLSQPNFLKIHRSYVINMDHMKSLNKNSFETMTGKEIPISRNLLTEVHTQYVNYLHPLSDSNIVQWNELPSGRKISSFTWKRAIPPCTFGDGLNALLSANRDRFGRPGADYL